MADYFLSCLRELRSQWNGKILVYHWPVNPEAPFQFDFPEGVTFKDRTGVTVEELKADIQKNNPAAIITSGWIDKDYLKAVKGWKKQIPCVVTIDNHWRGDVRQRIATLMSPFVLRSVFNTAWVAGEPQKTFAQKLGFRKILTGFYSADVTRFNAMYEKFHPEKKSNFPKRIIYVGRYVKHKGIYDLWTAFHQACEESGDNEWELWCLGTGDEYENRIDHPRIKHFGFVQPSDISKFISDTSVFVLPSNFEPWGVVVHEFAAAGYPLICSNEIGAGDQFITEGENGFRFAAGDVDALALAFQKVFYLTTPELLKMGESSHQKGQTITPDSWSKTVLSQL